MLSANPTFSFQNMDGRTGVHGVNIRHFLRRKLMVSAYKLQMNREIIDYEKLDRISFVQFVKMRQESSQNFPRGWIL